MQALYDFFIERLSDNFKDRLAAAISHQAHLNPNERIQKGVCIVLEEVLMDIDELEVLLKYKIELSHKKIIDFLKSTQRRKAKKVLVHSRLLHAKETALQLASLSCYLLPKMKATKEFIALLKRVKHPYIDLFIAYFEEDPSNYQATREKIEVISSLIRERSDFTDEMNAHLLAIRSWIYGEIGEVTILKDIYNSVIKYLPNTTNLIEIWGLQDATINVIWWLLHSGVEDNIEEMVNFLEPYIDKYKLYMSYTDFLNLKGAIYSYFGDNVSSINYFSQLIEEHTKYHDNYRLSIAIGNLAESFICDGKIILAKEMLEQAITLYKESTGKWPFLYLTELGNLYYLVGDSQAEDSFIHAYEIQRNETSLFKAFILFELIHYYLRIEQIEKAKEFLDEIRFLAKELQAISVNAQVEYLNGYYEMLEENFTSAIKYMQTSLDLAHISKDFNLILSCNIQLAAIYLQRYRLNEKHDILNTALNYLDTAILLAVENTHNNILAIGYVIRSLLRASKKEFKDATEDLQRAKIIIEQLDYDKWKKEFLQLEAKISKAEKVGKMILDHETMFDYIMPQFKTMLSFKFAERRPVESEILGLLIISESGVPIYTRISSTLKADKFVLSGLLTAISHFSESIVEGKDKGRLREVLYEELWLVVQPLKNGLIAVLGKEATAEIRMQVNSLANKIVEVPKVISELTNNLAPEVEKIIKRMNIH